MFYSQMSIFSGSRSKRGSLSRCILSLGLLMCLSFTVSELSATPRVEGATGESTTGALSDIIPASSPYAFGYEPSVTGEREASLDLRSIEDWWDTIQARAEALSATWTEDEREVWRRIMSLPLPKTQAEWSAMGVSRAPHFWIYGLGLTPALVIKVPDVKKLHLWSRSNLSASKLGFVEIKHARGVYWRRAMKRWTLLVRVHKDLVHFALLPQSAEPVLLSFFLRDRQTDNLTEKLRRMFDLLPESARGSGMIQLSSITDLFFGSNIPILKHSGASLGLPSPLFSSCEDDLRAISATSPTLTFGLERQAGPKSPHMASPQRAYELYTHLEISQPLQARLSALQERAEPRRSPKRSDALELGLRFDLQALTRLIHERGQSWRDHPWRCKPLRTLNGLSDLTSRPQFGMFMNFVGGVHGMTTRIERESPEEIKRRRETGILAPNDLGSIFAGWVELIHENAPLFASFAYSAITQTQLQAPFNQPDHIMRSISDLFPRLPQPMFSLHPERLIFSVGERGQAGHKRHITLLDKRSPIDSSTHLKPLSSRRPPLLWLDIPPKLSEWFSRRLESYKGGAQSRKSESQSAQDSASQPRLESIQVHTSSAGLMIQSTLIPRSSP